MFFRKKSKEGLRKLDTVVTGLIIGSAIAAIYGKKKQQKVQEGKKPTPFDIFRSFFK